VWNVRRKLAWLILVPLAVVAAAILSLPLLLNSADYKALLVEQAEAQLGRKVEMAQAHVEVLPYVRVALDDVVIREADGRTAFLSAQRLFVDLRIFPLLRRKVIAKRILLDHPKVAVKRGADGRLNVADLFAPTQEGGFALPMLVEQTVIADGQIVFEDAFRTETPRTLALRRVTTAFKAGPRELSFKFFAAMPYGQGESTFNVTGQVLRVATSGSGVGGKAEGRVETKGVNLQQLTPYLQDHALLSGLAGVVDLAAVFEYRWAQGDRSLSFKEMKIDVARTAVTGSVELKGLFSPQMRFSGNFSTAPFSVASLVGVVPEDVLRARAMGFLRDGQVAGQVSLSSVQVSGASDAGAGLTVRGEMELSGGSAFVGADRVPLSDVKGLLRLDADRVVIERLTGRYGLAEVTEGMGEVTNLTEDPELLLDIKGRLSAQELAVIVARFAPKAVLPGGPLGLSGLQGGAVATVRLTGPLARFDDLQVDWALETKDVGFTDARLTLPVKGLQGGVHSIRRGVTFEHMTGSVGTSALVLDGDIAVQNDEKAHYDLHISGQLDVKEVWPVAVGGATKDLAVDGTAGLRMRLSGRTDALRGTGRLDLHKTRLAHTAGLGKPKGVPGSVEFDLVVDPGRLLKLDRVVLEIPPFSVYTKGTMTLQAPQRFALDVRVPPFAVRALPKGMLAMKVPPNGGIFQADIAMTGLLDNWRAAKLKGRAAVKQAGFKLEGLADPVEDLNLDVSFEDDRIEIERGTVKIKDSRINAKGTVRGWRGIPLLQMSFDSPGLDLELLIPEGARSPVRAAMETISREAKLTATTAVRNGVYHGVLFDEIRATVSGGETAIVLDPVAGRTGGGTVAGQARITLPEGKPAAVESSLQVEGVAVEPLFQAFGVKEPPFTGTLKLDGALRGDGSNPHGTSPTLNGDVRVMIKKGYFRKLSATSKIIGIMNLPTLLAGKVDFSDKGMPFECITGRVVVKNGIAEVQNYLVESPIMKITGAGTYDIPNDRYDMVMVVSPFGSYDELLKSIPLFGKLFVGDREGLTTAFFEVKGPLADPTVTWVPIKSVASGVTGFAQLAFDVMKNVLLLPAELISPTKKARSPCSVP